MYKTKALAIIALSGVMTACVAGGLGYAKLNKADSALAEAASYDVTEQQTVKSWTNETISKNSVTPLTLEGVASGQYCITVTITAGAGTDYYSVNATGNGETVNLSLSYLDSEPDTFYGVINVEENGTLEISTDSEAELTADIQLDNLYLGARNGFYLQDIELPANSTPLDIDIVGSTVKAFTVQVDFGETEFPETLTAEIGGVKKQLTQPENTNLGVYAATFELPADAAVSKLTLESTSLNPLTGSVSLFQLENFVTMTDDAATAENIKLWQTAVFSYTPHLTNYRTARVSSATEGAETIEASITYGKTAGNYSGVPIGGEDYPLYLEEGTTYYFEVTLSDISGTAETVDLTLSLGIWESPTIKAGGTYSVPVTPANDDHKILNLEAPEGKYELALTEVPYDYPLRGVVIFAYIGNSEPIELNAENGYTNEVVISDDNQETTDEVVNTTIYFTTSEISRFTISIGFREPVVLNYIDLGTPTDITVPANSSVVYFIKDAEAGEYSVMLAQASPYVSVWVNEEYPIIPEGKTVGGFAVRYEAGSDYAITFKNSGNEEVAINATVKRETDNTLQLGIENTISLEAGQIKAYFIYGLAAGNFETTITHTSGLELTVDGKTVMFTAGKATITIDSVQDANGLVNFTFENTGAEAETYTVIVTPENVIDLNTDFTITVEPDEYGYYYTAYYVNVTEGNSYVLQLDLPEGMFVSVTQNGADLIFYGGYVGAFTAEYTGFVTLRFNFNVYGEGKTLTAHFIDSAAMPINKSITVDTSKMSTYIAYLYPGNYSINIENNPGVKILINSVEIEGNSFEVYDYSGVTITFVYNGNFEASLVPANIMMINTDTEITLEAYSSKTYYLELGAGNYGITLTNGEKIQVSVDGNVVIGYDETSVSFKVTLEEGQTSKYFAITFETDSDTAVTFNAYVGG